MLGNGPIRHFGEFPFGIRKKEVPLFFGLKLIDDQRRNDLLLFSRTLTRAFDSQGQSRCNHHFIIRRPYGIVPLVSLARLWPQISADFRNGVFIPDLLNCGEDIPGPGMGNSISHGLSNRHLNFPLVSKTDSGPVVSGQTTSWSSDHCRVSKLSRLEP